MFAAVTHVLGAGVETAVGLDQCHADGGEHQQTLHRAARTFVV